MKKRIFIDCLAGAAIILCALLTFSCKSDGGTDRITFKINVDPAQKRLVVGEDFTLTATVTPSEAGYTNYSVVWESDTPAVATVSGNGVVTAIAEGNARITASVVLPGSQLVEASAACMIAVSDELIPTFQISVDPTQKRVIVGEDFTITATVIPSEAGYTDYEVVWESDTPVVATVDGNGMVTAIAEGNARITASVVLPGSQLVEASATCEVEVSNVVVPTFQISVAPETKELTEGESFTLTATVTPSEAGYTDYSVVWKSDTPAVATVDGNGMVTAVAEGNARITASVVLPGSQLVEASAACEVAVWRTATQCNEIYRFTLTDKGTETSMPVGEYLSTRAQQRRSRQGIATDLSDLPISQQYLEEIKSAGGKIVSRSKWLNTVCVHVGSDVVRDKISALPFVGDSKLIWKGSITRSVDKFASVTQGIATRGYTQADYGQAWNSIHIHNGEALHTAGFEGQGIHIAVVDTGFPGAETYLPGVDIKGAKSFIYNDPAIYGGTYSHGMEVLSCMAGDIPGSYVGTAPGASYWLLRTEDIQCEAPIEEDYMVAAFEYADSVGADIITTSLGYKTFDSPFKSYTTADTDGRTSHCTRGAEAAFDKGIFVLTAAGNDAAFVSPPGDGPNVLAVGGIKTDKSMYLYSSYGMTVDGRYKPDVLALGNPTPVITETGSIASFSGTSLACPIMAGLAACLWQSKPSLTNKQLLDIVRRSADKYSAPQLPYGYGIADMQQAMTLAASE